MIWFEIDIMASLERLNAVIYINPGLTKREWPLFAVSLWLAPRLALPLLTLPDDVGHLYCWIMDFFFQLSWYHQRPLQHACSVKKVGDHVLWSEVMHRLCHAIPPQHSLQTYVPLSHKNSIKFQLCKFQWNSAFINRFLFYLTILSTIPWSQKS